MSAYNLTPADRKTDETQKIGPDEETIIGSSNSARRKILDSLWAIKLRIQYTGWLQYIPVATAALAILLGVKLPAAVLILISILLLSVLIFDLVTVKFQIHPAERLPKRNDHLNMFDLMRTRRSCRSFQNRSLTPADHCELMEAVRRHLEAPMIGEAPIRFEYLAAPLTVWPVVNAREFLVAIVPAAYDRLAVIDVGRSLQKVVMDATRMGLGTCWIGPGADHASIKRHLGNRLDSEKDHIICVLAVGYISRYIPLFLRIFNRQFRRRLPLSALFFADPSFETPLDVATHPFNQFGRTYEICQWAPSSYNGQTTRGVALTAPGYQGVENRLVRLDFYTANASRYYAPVALGIWCANWELGCQAIGIPGHFATLLPEERGIPHDNEQLSLPRYDVSWVPDKQI